MASSPQTHSKKNHIDNGRKSPELIKSNSADDQTVSTGHSNVSAVLASENKNAIWLSKRPVLKAFFHHIITMLDLLPFSDYDGYIRELQATIEDCMGAQRFKRAVAAAHYAQQHRRNVVNGLHASDTSTHHSMFSSFVDTEDRVAAANGRFFWEEEGLRPEDPQLKALLHELSTQTCALHSPLLIEAKTDRLINAYFSLRVRTQRMSISYAIHNVQMSDPQRCLQFFDLFAINFFSSDTHHVQHPQHSPAQSMFASEAAHHHHHSNGHHHHDAKSASPVQRNPAAISAAAQASFKQPPPGPRTLSRASTSSTHNLTGGGGGGTATASSVSPQQRQKEQRAHLVLKHNP